MSTNKRPGALGIIGGSGVYDIEGLSNTRWEKVASPFGEPSDAFLFGELHGQQLVFLPRHGRGHRLPPTEINYRANIDALKRAGVTDVISVSAVGSLREHLRPGTFVIVDQFIDRTFARAKSFFGTGLVAHVSMARPVCRRLGDHLEAAAREADIEVARGGTYLVMEGPQFSTRAESEIYRSWGVDVIGMTNLQEARLAREAEICYSTLAMVTDYDCWHETEEDVSVDAVLEALRQNAAMGQEVVRRAVAASGGRAACSCGEALRSALITDRSRVPAATLAKLAPIVGKYFAKPAV